MLDHRQSGREEDEPLRLIKRRAQIISALQEVCSLQGGRSERSRLQIMIRHDGLTEVQQKKLINTRNCVAWSDTEDLLNCLRLCPGHLWQEMLFTFCSFFCEVFTPSDFNHVGLFWVETRRAAKPGAVSAFSTNSNATKDYSGTHDANTQEHTGPAFLRVHDGFQLFQTFVSCLLFVTGVSTSGCFRWFH